MTLRFLTEATEMKLPFTELININADQLIQLVPNF